MRRKNATLAKQNANGCAQRFQIFTRFRGANGNCQQHRKKHHALHSGGNYQFQADDTNATQLELQDNGTNSRVAT
jgi:hypothetical protein